MRIGIIGLRTRPRECALCTHGRTAIREYCLKKELPSREVGSLVVAVNESELPALAELKRRSIENGVPDLTRVDSAGMRLIEPHVAGPGGLHSQHTAVVDYSAITHLWRMRCWPPAE